MESGKYIVIEGNDGTGKSTQVELLATWLKEEKGIDSFIAHEPAGTPIADAIRTIIKDGTLARATETELLLFTAARHEIWQEAKKHLAEGHWVLSARNYISTLAYQGSGFGMSSELIIETTRQFTDARYMQPDYTFVLTLADETERLARIAARGTVQTPKDAFESQPEDFHRRVDEAYVSIAQTNAYRVINGARLVTEIQQEIQSILSESLTLR